MKNKYMEYSRVCEAKLREVLSLFCEDVDVNAVEISNVVKINRNTANSVLHFCQQELLKFGKKNGISYGEIGVDEIYFGAKRVGGKRGCVGFGKRRYLA
jgi:hypothetical protein